MRWGVVRKQEINVAHNCGGLEGGGGRCGVKGILHPHHLLLMQARCELLMQGQVQLVRSLFLAPLLLMGTVQWETDSSQGMVDTQKMADRQGRWLPGSVED